MEETKGGRPMADKKILFCASTLSHIRSFHLPYLRAFQQRGYEVWVAADRAEALPCADRVVALPFQKKLTSPRNLSAVLAVRRLMKRERFTLVSTHTALAGAVCRAACLAWKERPMVVNTVHGFLFSRNDGLRKWVYLLPEKLLRRVTDVELVMNREDEGLCRDYRLSRRPPLFIDGMGVELSRWTPRSDEEKTACRRAAGVEEDAFVFVYAAEFSRRKNQAQLIRAFARASERMPSARLILAGTGALLEECRRLAASLGAARQILFPGYVEEMPALFAAADAVVSTSRSEGLPFHVLEAMASALPVLASDVKGHRELVRPGENGLLFPPDDTRALERGLLGLYEDREGARRMGMRGRRLAKPYDLRRVRPQIMGIYEAQIRRWEQERGSAT